MALPAQTEIPSQTLGLGRASPSFTVLPLAVARAAISDTKRTFQRSRTGAKPHRYPESRTERDIPASHRREAFLLDPPQKWRRGRATTW
jgi:hypothetical protein